MTSTPRRSGVVLIVVGMLAVLLLMMAVNLHHALPMATWWQAVANPETDDLRQLLFHYSLLPRVALQLLVGAGLGLAGLLFQQVLRNPLAEPATLGIATGAQLGVTVATLTVATLSMLPGVEVAQQWMAMAGALGIGVLVFGLSWGFVE